MNLIGGKMSKQKEVIEDSFITEDCWDCNRFETCSTPELDSMQILSTVSTKGHKLHTVRCNLHVAYSTIKAV